MSAHGQQIEREYSAQSLTSRGGSEMGSRYTVESGFYLSSYAAAVLIAALVIVGFSLITILVALTVMLQSCQSKNDGAVELLKSSDAYSYCKIFAFHAELNSLDTGSFPVNCVNFSIRYIKDGQYMRDLNTSVWVVENYFSNVKPLDDGLDVVLMDVDDLFPSDSHSTDMLLPQFNKYGCNNCIEEAQLLKRMFVLKLYMKIQASGFSLILLSRKPEKLRNASIEHLVSVGCSGWSSLIMRFDDEMQMDSREYLSRHRILTQEGGFRIMAVISSQMDALTGPCLGKRVFKLPNPLYYNVEASY